MNPRTGTLVVVSRVIASSIPSRKVMMMMRTLASQLSQARS